MRRLRWRHVRCAAYLVAARATIALTKLKHLVTTTPRHLATDIERAQSLAAMLERVADHLPLATTCLHRALALLWLLRSHGLGATLRIGIRSDGGHFAAHAWVEHGGVVLFDEDASQFVPFDAPILTSE